MTGTIPFMDPANPRVQSVPDLLRERLVRARLDKGLTPTEVDDILHLGAGWTRAMEAGILNLTLDMVLALAGALDTQPGELFRDLPPELRADPLRRGLHAVENGQDLDLLFPYGGGQARYTLPKASQAQLDEVLGVLRKGLKDTTRKTLAVVKAYERAMELWPHANPSDVWTFLIGRAYCDEYNHPASEVGGGRSVSQSWKRTGGRALEQFIVRRYKKALAAADMELVIDAGPKLDLLAASRLLRNKEVNLDKVDLVLSKKGEFVGVVHVKTSFAERRTDDVPLSRVILEAGGLSLFWTLDVKSIPSVAPVNAGELGLTWLRGSGAPDLRSDKRKDFEDRGEFSGCFSYNINTKATPAQFRGPKARIYVSRFVDPFLDPFTTYVLAAT